MSRSRERTATAAAAALTLALAAVAVPAAASADADGERSFGLGRPALAAEIAAWDIDVAPDGTGLPPGAGSVLDGEELFAEYCAACHGDFAEGLGNWPELAGGIDTLADADPVKTVGSYWPYLTTAWDYINRSMPYDNVQTLEADQVYAVLAYILYSSDLVDEDFVLTAENLPGFALPNRDGFVVDDRPTAEYAPWTGAPCMRGCKDGVQITSRAALLGVTPGQTGDDPALRPAPATDPHRRTGSKPRRRAPGRDRRGGRRAGRSGRRPDETGRPERI